MSLFVRKSGRWSPKVIQNVYYVNKRFSSDSSGGNHMPWPFDKYKMPAAAKKWLSKYPAQRSDDFEEEFVYLDEIEGRINSHFKTQRKSERYRKHQNEYAVTGDWDDIDKTYPYPSTGGNEHGRGRLVNPQHYVNPQYALSARVYVDNVKITPRKNLRNRGELGAQLEMPPETPSIFKMWNFYHMFAAWMIVMVGKEHLILSGHETHHFVMNYGFLCWTGALMSEWWLWWKALRTQEFYDQRFFPLQENVDNLFTLLDRLEKKPDLGVVLSKYHVYIGDLRQRLVGKRTEDTIMQKRAQINGMLEKRLMEESGVDRKLQKDWTEKAMQNTLAHFEDSSICDAFFDVSFGAFCKDGAELGSTPSLTDVVAAKFGEERSSVEAEWYVSNRKNGTLPWTHATEAEREAAMMSKEEKQEIYTETIENLTAKYHKFAF